MLAILVKSSFEDIC